METSLCIIKGYVDYPSCSKTQELLVDLRSKNKVSDILLMLEHRPVITLGLRSHPEDILASKEELAKNNIGLFKTIRGGSVTYHGPGQIVIYPILKLGSTEADAHSYLFNLEEVAIRACADFGIAAFRKAGKTGAWTSAGKIAAIGVRFRRWITFHGMSFNVEPDMKHFNFIVPCGLIGEKVTSLKELLQKNSPLIVDVKQSIVRNFGVVFQRMFVKPAVNKELIKIIEAEGWQLENW
jgi:lipoate-protein ligase B